MMGERAKVSDSGQGAPLKRRSLLAGIPLLGAATLAGCKRLLGLGRAQQSPKPHAITSATIKTFEFKSLKDLKGKVPHARIGNLEVSRLILGGNLIGGWAHARDLIYVSALVKAYHHKWKVFETFRLAEDCGINAFLTNPVLCETINEYWRRGLGEIRFISDCGGDPKQLLTNVEKSIDNGASACYVQGGIADTLAGRGEFDKIGKALDVIRASGLPAGIGAHNIATVKGSVKAGLKPDFWMKTLHHTNYWSARHPEKHNSIWCEHPEETKAFMRDLPQPWVAYKVLAAGAIHPRVGFPFAFKGGADFICVGIYDFQIVEDVNIALDALAKARERERPWRA